MLKKPGEDFKSLSQTFAFCWEKIKHDQEG